MAKQNSLNTKEIFKGIRKEFWQELAESVKKMIRDDMISGEVQSYGSQKRNTSGGAQHYNKQYAKYKANYMNRFTDGRKLKSVGGKSVASNKTTQVNLMLTGQTIRGLHLDTVLDNGVILSYQPEDGYKLSYNEDMGRSITTLNEKNKKKVLDLYSKELDKSIRKWCDKTITIYAGK